MNSLDMLPAEIHFQIMGYLEPKSLSRLSMTSKEFHMKCSAEYFWLQYCREFGVNGLGSGPIRSYRKLYTQLLHNNGWLLGYWFGNFPVNGEFIKTEWDQDTNSLTAYRVSCQNTASPIVRPRANNPAPLHIEQLSLTTRKDKIFSVSINEITSKLEFRCAENHAVELWKRPFHSHEGSNLWATMENELKTDPNSATDLQTPSIPSAERPSFSWKCCESCHEFAGFHANGFIPGLAKLHPDEVQPTKERPMQGVWVGTYGMHGCEILLFNQNPATHELTARKLTGDLNIPRSELTFVAHMDDEHKHTNLIGFENGRLFKGQGQIATLGFFDRSMTDIEVIVLSEDEVAVHWPSLNRIARYQRVLDSQASLIC
ncbi:hypothetical protein K493DRAFT_310030 [Basidiobolus meristosporus CBS 931.73]|uniref:F-box domain-containing protein n=1 Tax=Basidiobolus meristosporus CBS 931.73 TaxID=1314790 RepID=A0A1Y1ZCL9_9FUNG|nr:hypothetical protein K493DRAFT_310030 [Basidiobolus meristosporus CBS 931.73]|eukprot:ORY08022.1 hypothetical protein K493DRAFT_310030 [Basidiobolus meristosporus CBS 931.73]